MCRLHRTFACLGLLLAGCGVKHSPPVNTVFRIESREGALHLVYPSRSGGIAGWAVPFSQIISIEYGYNPWEQYVDLSRGMRLSVFTLTGETATSNSFYEILGAGRARLRLQRVGPEPFDKHTRYLRLFYQTKFLASAGQPIRPALCLWSDSREELGERTAEARQNPDFSCGDKTRECLAFPGRTTVSPELPVVVNQKPRYVLLGSTVRDLLRADRVTQAADIRVLRKYDNQMVPVTWQQAALVQSLPLVGGDEISW